MKSPEPASNESVATTRGSYFRLLTWLADAWRSWTKAYRQAQRNRRDQQALSELDDHQLEDIGLRRDQLSSFAAAELREWRSAYRESPRAVGSMRLPGERASQPGRRRPGAPDDASARAWTSAS